VLLYRLRSQSRLENRFKIRPCISVALSAHLFYLLITHVLPQVGLNLVDSCLVLVVRCLEQGVFLYSRVSYFKERDVLPLKSLLTVGSLVNRRQHL
jgi:hypothetical protein